MCIFSLQLYVQKSCKTHYKDVPFCEVTMDIEKQYKEQLNLCFIKNNQGIIIENEYKKILTAI